MLCLGDSLGYKSSGSSHSRDLGFDLPFGSIGIVGLDNLRLGGALKWKVETVGSEGQGVVCGKLAPLRL
jgi:hypothetical protein